MKEEIQIIDKLVEIFENKSHIFCDLLVSKYPEFARNISLDIEMIIMLDGDKNESELYRQ